MSSPAIGIETLPPEIRYATPMRDIPQLAWVASQLLTLPYGDYMLYCDGTKSDPHEVYEWALKHGT